MENIRGRGNYIKKAKAVAALLLFIVLVFGICLDAYYMYKLPAEGLSFILLGVASACITDIVSQLLLLIAISATQFACEVRGRKLPLDTNKLRRMTVQANDVSKRVF